MFSATRIPKLIEVVRLVVVMVCPLEVIVNVRVLVMVRVAVVVPVQDDQLVHGGWLFQVPLVHPVQVDDGHPLLFPFCPFHHEVHSPVVQAPVDPQPPKLPPNGPLMPPNPPPFAKVAVVVIVVGVPLDVVVRVRVDVVLWPLLPLLPLVMVPKSRESAKALTYLEISSRSPP